MKVFLSGLESSEDNIIKEYLKKGIEIDYALTSFFYCRKKKTFIDNLKRFSKEILVDSGAHSFQKGKKVDWVEYTKEYAEWILKNDNEQILGYFEMDVDNIIGYDNVLELRKILESVTDKIIPVWHKNRGVEDFKKMCRDYQGKIIAITGFRNEDIQDNQYIMFLKYAKRYNCKVHCLGMTRVKLLNHIPFDFVDSSTWKQAGNYGEISRFKNGNLKREKHKGKFKTADLDLINFEEFVSLQKYYKYKWKNVKWRSN